MTPRAARLFGAAVLVALASAGAIAAAACSSSSSGSAPATPVEVGTVTGSIQALALVGTDVYCGTFAVDDGSIVKIPTQGGAAVTYAEHEPAGQLYSDGHSLVWRNALASLKNGDHEEIKVAPIASGASPKVVVPKVERAIAFDGAFVYWSVQTDVFPKTIYDVKRTSIADGTETTLATAQEDVAGLAVDDATFYFGSAEGIWSMPKAGGTPGVLLKDAAGLGGAGSLVVDDARVYYIGATGGGATSNFVASIPKAGGARTEYDFGCQSVAAIAIDGGSLYGLCNTDIQAFKTTRHHTVRRAPKSGGTAATIGELTVFDAAGDPDSFDALVIDGSFVYVADKSRLVKVPK